MRRPRLALCVVVATSCSCAGQPDELALESGIATVPQVLGPGASITGRVRLASRYTVLPVVVGVYNWETSTLVVARVEGVLGEGFTCRVTNGFSVPAGNIRIAWIARGRPQTGAGGRLELDHHSTARAPMAAMVNR